MLQSENQSNRQNCRASENAAILFARLAAKRVVDLSNHPIISKQLQPESLTEIAGPAGSGKSSILIDVAARCLLPETDGGLGTGVVFIDCDRQFHVDRLISAIGRVLERNRYYNAIPVVSSNDDQKVTECLESFRYVACDRSGDLLDAFDALDDALPSADWNSGKGWLVMIDGINSFYWLDRSSRSRVNATQMQRQYAQRLQQFLMEHNAPAVATRLILARSNDNAKALDSGRSFDRRFPRTTTSSAMDSAWTALVTSSIYLSTAEVQSKRKAILDDGAVVYFQADCNGISYF